MVGCTVLFIHSYWRKLINMSQTTIIIIYCMIWIRTIKQNSAIFLLRFQWCKLLWPSTIDLEWFSFLLHRTFVRRVCVEREKMTTGITVVKRTWKWPKKWCVSAEAVLCPNWRVLWPEHQCLESSQKHQVKINKNVLSNKINKY